MEKIIEYKKLLRQRTKLQEELEKQTDTESKNIIKNKIDNIEETIDQLIKNSQELQTYINREFTKNTKSCDSTTQTETPENEKIKGWVKKNLGCLFWFALWIIFKSILKHFLKS